MFNGVIGEHYSRDDVQQLLGVPSEKRGGNWDTGYTEWDGQFFIFCNIDVAGRTGHDYRNYWDGPDLVWQAKNGTNITQPQIQKLISGRLPVHIFHRELDRAPFTYAGTGYSETYHETVPVTVRWSLKASFDQKDILREILAERGFKLSAPGKKTQKASIGKITLYIKIDSDTLPLVIGPEWVDWLTDFDVAGAQRPRNRLFYHNSTMRAYPKKVHNGTRSIPFGLDFGFSSRLAVQRFLDVLLNTPQPMNFEPAAGQSDFANVDPRTETETTRAARLKQSKFRSDLLKRHKKCMLTQIDMPDLLRASHVKPWAKSTHKERVDPENGLLLALHVDGLFDKGLISFDEDGKILISNKVTSFTRLALALNPEWRIEMSGSRQTEYMRYHRTTVYVGARWLADRQATSNLKNAEI